MVNALLPFKNEYLGNEITNAHTYHETRNWLNLLALFSTFTYTQIPRINFTTNKQRRPDICCGTHRTTYPADRHQTASQTHPHKSPTQTRAHISISLSCKSQFIRTFAEIQRCTIYPEKKTTKTEKGAYIHISIFM